MKDALSKAVTSQRVWFAGVTVLAFVLRLMNLGWPNKLLFDETYYAKDAYALLHGGFERSWSDAANKAIEAGDAAQIAQAMSSNGSFVVHPPLGKWLIAAGEAVFGFNGFGWRISACVFGTLMVLGVMALTRRVSGSLAAAVFAGLFLTLDGLAFVMSRLALLDIFQATFLVWAVWAFVVDRAVPHTRWRWVEGVLFGAACAVKWNSMFVLAVFGVLTVVLDAWEARGLSWSWLGRAAWAFVQLVGTGALVYVASWIPWFASAGGWDRQWGRNNPHDKLVGILGPDLASWLTYHRQVYEFHTGDGIARAIHPYASNPWLWPVMGRNIGIDVISDIAPGQQGCPLDQGTCFRVINGLGNPAVWIPGLGAVLFLIVWAFAQRSWKPAVPVLAFAATWLPWCVSSLSNTRPLFFFYAVLMIPFTACALGWCTALVWNSKHRIWAAIFVMSVLILFWFFWPVWTDGVLSSAAWNARMWLKSWI